MLQQIVETTPYTTTRVKNNSYCLTSHPSLILEGELLLVPIKIILKKPIQQSINRGPEKDVLISNVTPHNELVR